MFYANDFDFIWTGAMTIRNDRNDTDCFHVSSEFWPGILIGTDGYPKTN